jgi:hypothetical protein
VILAATSEWRLTPGESISRKELQEEFGGRTQGGIGPSKRTPNVFLFSDPVSGEQHGYIDGWMPDGAFHYTGEGQRGDQRMVSGNRSILDHQKEGRSLRLFFGARGNVKYVDEVELDAEEPWYETDAPETGGGPVRKVIVFKLRPKSIEPRPSQSRHAAAVRAPEIVQHVPIEEQRTEKTYVDPDREPYEAERKEAALVMALRNLLISRGHNICRQQILPPGEHKPIFTDLYDATSQILFEAKGAATREAMRMAIGQLADYARFLGDVRRAVLMPTRPRQDLMDLALSEGVAVVWPREGGYSSSVDGLL